MYLAKNLRYLRRKSGLSQEYIAEKFNYKSYTTIQKWEAGTSEPSISVANELAKMYNVTMDDMYSINLEAGGNSKDISKLPLLGEIAAGTPILAEQNIEDYFSIDTRIKADFALRIKGDSMINAGIYENDIVFIHKQNALENGEIGAILIEDEATLKRFYFDNGNVILQAENDNLKPRVYKEGSLRILGKLVAVLNIRNREVHHKTP